MARPAHDDLQSLCDAAQQQLQRMEYLACERTLVRAEQLAFAQADFDTLARLYMPLQEARRQRRLICAEGIVKLDLLARDPHDAIDVEQVISRHPRGQFLVAGWGSIAPAIRLRELAWQRQLYVETFLAAVYPVGAARAVVIAPTADVRLPEPLDRSVDELIRQLPARSIVLSESEIPRGERRGDTETCAHTSSLWQRLHAPFLAAADVQVDLMQKIQGYRRTIEVDYACELAHQHLSAAARQLARDRRAY